MAKSSMPSVCYLIMLSVCIDQGDGRWKERDKENLEHDLEMYQKITEKLEREMDTFYDEYPNGWLRGDNVERIHSKYLTNLLDRNTDIKNFDDTDKDIFPFVSSGTYVTRSTESRTETSIVHNNPNKYKTTDWPTFQDILLAMGRKYDWKNDRWIKVKKKPNIKHNTQMNDEIASNNSEKHKFSYRIVKLSKSKSRRNIVVAVSAVR